LGALEGLPVPWTTFGKLEVLVNSLKLSAVTDIIFNIENEGNFALPQNRKQAV
jgi:hypothetical protein